MAIEGIGEKQSAEKKNFRREKRPQAETVRGLALRDRAVWSFWAGAPSRDGATKGIYENT